MTNGQADLSIIMENPWVFVLTLNYHAQSPAGLCILDWIWRTGWVAGNNSDHGVTVACHTGDN
jgi:hypothetical protein